MPACACTRMGEKNACIHWTPPSGEKPPDCKDGKSPVIKCSRSHSTLTQVHGNRSSHDRCCHSCTVYSVATFEKNDTPHGLLSTTVINSV
ncbi:hypothetical protein NDU88_000917 [Pleurodeles waltl]|uniref:Uncharacterized protein n=1 Tax=Pleurodeles waltl TaxID=8319 RepID=A0AAV7WMR3_PLEWA|nr:hypothetical protein NDU88_000917 [Pleurodeles waltl]